MSSVLPINNLVPLLVSGVALVSAVAAYQVGKTSSGKDNKTEAPPPVIPSVIKQYESLSVYFLLIFFPSLVYFQHQLLFNVSVN